MGNNSQRKSHRTSRADGWRQKLAVGGGLLVASGTAGPHAHAETRQLQTEFGLFVTYHFGGAQPNQVGFGAEVREMYAPSNLSYCGGADAAAFGGLVGRIEAVSWDRLQLLVAPTVGVMRGPGSSASAELAFGYRQNNDPAAGSLRSLLFQLGVEGAFINTLGLRAAYAISHGPSVGLTGRLGNTTGIGCPVVGRPRRRPDGELAPGARVTCERVQRGVANERRTAPASADLPPPESAFAAQARACALWTERARTEWASVPAFLDLAAMLDAGGAPTELSRQARAAAGDEMEHALLSAGVASRLGGGLELTLTAPARGTLPPAAPQSAPAADERWLRRLARESWLDGCVGEGVAAAVAATEAQLADDATIRAIQRRIAGDEARHAALAWEVLTFAAQQADGPLRATLAREGAEATGLLRADRLQQGTSAADGDLGGYGCLPPMVRAVAAERHAASSAARLAALLTGV